MRRVAPVLGFVGVGLWTYAWLVRIGTPFPIHGDGMRDQMMVRDCVELGRCHLFGAQASIGGAKRTFQGAVWLDILTAVRLLGGDTSTQMAVVLVLDALAPAVTFIVVWHWLAPALALPAAYWVAADLAGEPTVFMLANSSASALFNVMTAAGLLCYALSNRTRYLLVAAFAAALAVNVHVAAITLVPGLLLVAAMADESSRAIVTAITVFAAVYAATSGTAFAANLLAVADRGWGVLALAVVAGGALGVASRFAPRFRELSPNVRAAIVGGVLILPFAAGALWLVLVEGHWFEIRYLHPIWAPLAVFRAAMLCAPFLLLGKRSALLRAVPSMMAFCWLLPMPWGPGPLRDGLRTWTYTDATTIGRAAADAGWSFEDLVFRLQGQAAGELLAGIAGEGPRPRDQSPAEDLQLQVAVSDTAPAPAPDDSVVVPLERGRFGVLRIVRSWMQPRGIEVCRQPSDPRVPPSCERPRVKVAGDWVPFDPVALAEDARHPIHFSFENRALLTILPIRVPPPYVTSYRIPVHPRAGESREFRIADRGSPGCRWEFVHTDGVRTPTTLPATHLRLDPDGDGPGELVIAKPFGSPPCPIPETEYPYPPGVWETRPGDAFDRLVGGTQ